jgi:hypothetical protein
MEMHVALGAGIYQAMLEHQVSSMKTVQKSVDKLDDNPNNNGATTYVNTNEDNVVILKPIQERGTLFDILL